MGQSELYIYTYRALLSYWESTMYVRAQQTSLLELWLKLGSLYAPPVTYCAPGGTIVGRPRGLARRSSPCYEYR